MRGGLECPRCYDGNENMKSKTTKMNEAGDYVTVRKCIVCGHTETP